MDTHRVGIQTLPLSPNDIAMTRLNQMSQVRTDQSKDWIFSFPMHNRIPIHSFQTNTILGSRWLLSPIGETLKYKLFLHLRVGLTGWLRFAYRLASRNQRQGTRFCVTTIPIENQYFCFQTWMRPSKDFHPGLSTGVFTNQQSYGNQTRIFTTDNIRSE